jgi:formamidopyrimidine-DNA glycosylase
MIELPEALVVARQLNAEIAGKRIASAVRGNTPHKFAFYSRPAEEYAAILSGKTVGEATGHGSAILVPVEPGYTLVLGGGGERILLHRDESTLPRKHHLLLRFQEGAMLTVTVQGWGNVLLLDESDLVEHPHVGYRRVAPLSDAFTFDYFSGLFGTFEEGDARSVKYFAISEPGVWGVGNGTLQDILFRARIHPRRRAVDLTGEERQALYGAIQGTLREMVELGGRDTERDLYGQRGGYGRIMHSKSAGEPCPECGTRVVKMQYLGGACYVCPRCQPDTSQGK